MFFFLDEKEPKSQDQTICLTHAKLLRVRSGCPLFQFKINLIF